MRYLGECNKLYQSVVQEAERSLKVVKSLSTSEMSLDHPARLLATHEVMVLHTILNTGHEVAARNVTRALMKFISPIDAAVYCIKVSPLYVNNDMENINDTFEDQFNNFLKLIYFHSYILNGGYIENASGSERESKVIYKKITNEVMYKFGEKTRMVDGYYLFIGAKESTVVLAGKPIKNNETLVAFFSTKSLTEFPDREQVEWIMRCHRDQIIVTTSISYLERYLASGSYKKFVKGLKV